MSAGRWPRCGSGQSSQRNDITALRSALERIENPDGVLRGTIRRGPVAPARPEPSLCIPEASASWAHRHLVLGASSVPLDARPHVARPQRRPQPSATQRPIQIPRDRPNKLSGVRAHAVVRFVGDAGGHDGDDRPPIDAASSSGPPQDWCCAICLRTTWAKVRLSRMPHCGHTFHSACVDKWFLVAADCPYCRQPV